MNVISMCGMAWDSKKRKKTPANYICKRIIEEVSNCSHLVK